MSRESVWRFIVTLFSPSRTSIDANLRGELLLTRLLFVSSALLFRRLDNNPAAWLTPTLNKVVMNSLGGDATDLYEALFGSSEYIACLEEMFYHGLLDDEFDTFCATLNIMMYVMLVFVATLMVVQFLASMIYVCPRHRTYSEEDVMSPVMIMVPCYNEGDNELRKTIKSVLVSRR